MVIIRMICYLFFFFMFLWLVKKRGEKYDRIDGKEVNKGYPHHTDNPETLLTRIEWANNYSQRKIYYHEYVLSAIIITIMVSFIFYNDFSPSIVKFMQAIMICTIILLALHNFFTFHGDKYHNIYINKNVKLLRKKLGMKRVRVLDNVFLTHPLTSNEKLKITD